MHEHIPVSATDIAWQKLPATMKRILESGVFRLEVDGVPVGKKLLELQAPLLGDLEEIFELALSYRTEGGGNRIPAKDIPAYIRLSHFWEPSTVASHQLAARVASVNTFPPPVQRVMKESFGGIVSALHPLAKLDVTTTTDVRVQSTVYAGALIIFNFIRNYVEAGYLKAAAAQMKISTAQEKIVPAVLNQTSMLMRKHFPHVVTTRGLGWEFPTPKLKPIAEFIADMGGHGREIFNWIHTIEGAATLDDAERMRLCTEIRELLMQGAAPIRGYIHFENPAGKIQCEVIPTPQASISRYPSGLPITLCDIRFVLVPPGHGDEYYPGRPMGKEGYMEGMYLWIHSLSGELSVMARPHLPLNLLFQEESIAHLQDEVLKQVHSAFMGTNSKKGELTKPVETDEGIATNEDDAKTEPNKKNEYVRLPSDMNADEFIRVLTRLNREYDDSFQTVAEGAKHTLVRSAQTGKVAGLSRGGKKMSEIALRNILAQLGVEAKQFIDHR